MGGKKKSLASRLAKMSDEERARYLQMKADQEEEARRRKEQLVTAFMKNKIKREDLFARLNKAKINQQWHQFMRLQKCREMKEECEHSKNLIERVIELKNRTIDGLMKELDEAEFQYSINLQAHLQHVDNLIEFHKIYFEQTRNEYQNDLDLLLKETFEEKKAYIEKFDGYIKHLKTVGYGQEIVGRGAIKEDHDYYLKLNEEFVKECRDDFKILRNKHYEASGSIWRNIFELLAGYVEKTDKRRAQLADMRRLDAESAVEINQNQERIDLQELQIEKLKDEYATLKITRANIIKSLETALKVVNFQALSAKQNLQAEITLDEKKLLFLIDISKGCIEYLEKLVIKGEFMLQLSQSCRRLETQKEKVLRFSYLPLECVGSISSTPSEESGTNRRDDVEEVFMKVRMESLESKNGEEDLAETSQQGIADEDKQERHCGGIKETKKYKILIKHKYRPKIRKSPQLYVGEKLKKELRMVTVPTTEVCAAKKKKSRKSQIDNDIADIESSSDRKTGVIEENLEPLMKLEAMWTLYNKVKLDCVELREEKACLMEENELLKREIKSLLEEAILKTKPPPKAHVKIRYVSAPPK